MDLGKGHCLLRRKKSILYLKVATLSKFWSLFRTVQLQRFPGKKRCIGLEKLLLQRAKKNAEAADEVLLKRKQRFAHLQNFNMLLIIC